MNKSGLKDGMVVEIRSGERRLVRGDDLSTLDFMKNICIDSYKDNLINEYENELDIMKIWDGYKLIWERKEVDWSKVPAGTKVLVSDTDEKEHTGYFIDYKANNEFYKFHVLIKKGDFYESCYWGNCKLTEELKEKVSYRQMIKELGELCDEYYEKNRTCKGCECFISNGLCDRNKIANDKFAITRN